METTTSAIGTMTSALTSGLSDMGNQMVGAVGEIVPVALPVMGALAVLFLGVKVFKKVTGAKN